MASLIFGEGGRGGEREEGKENEGRERGREGKSRAWKEEDK